MSETREATALTVQEVNFGDPQEHHPEWCVCLGDRILARCGKGPRMRRYARLFAAAAALRELLEWAMEKVKDAHYKCDLDNDADCYAEQYGDGIPDDHASIREATALMKAIEGR